MAPNQVNLSGVGAKCCKALGLQFGLLSWVGAKAALLLVPASGLRHQVRAAVSAPVQGHRSLNQKWQECREAGRLGMCSSSAGAEALTLAVSGLVQSAYEFFPFTLPPSYPLGFSHNYRMSLCDCMKGISSSYFLFFLKSASAHQLLSISVAHTLTRRAGHNASGTVEQQKSFRITVRQRLLKADCSKQEFSTLGPVFWRVFTEEPRCGDRAGLGALSECKVWELRTDLSIWRVFCSGYLLKVRGWMLPVGMGNYDPLLDSERIFYWY